MRKKLLKWFTLVEILIVIVIIGILIWALVPRMSAAQWRARDVARKNDLAQLQSAIVTSQQDKGNWPWMTSASSWDAQHWIWIDAIKKELETAWMNSVPADPLWSNVISGLWDGSIKIGDWQYWYMVSKRNGTENAGFVLMAKTEVEWWSNRVVCGSGEYSSLVSGGTAWEISKNIDLWTLKLCTKLNKDDNGTSWQCWNNWWNCTYTLDGQLRYILLY